MKNTSRKNKTQSDYLRSVAEFKKRFYPHPHVDEMDPSVPDPREVGDRMAKESLAKLRVALTTN